MKIHRLFSTLALVICTAHALVAHAQNAQPQYLIGPGDNIRVLVYQNPDLTLETRVTEGGTITYPLIGVINIGNMTVSAAELAIANALRTGGFIKQPQVTILPLQIRSSQISVLGQVGDPGRYPIETFNIRISEMIAIAGGIATTGADIAILTGTRNGQTFRKEIDIAGLFLDSRIEDDIVVAGGDIIYVHRMPMFYIYGEVQSPGSYRIEREMTIRQALALGGGPTARGTERRLTLHRRSNDKVIESSPKLDNLVRPNDVLYIGESLF